MFAFYCIACTACGPYLLMPIIAYAFGLLGIICVAAKSRFSAGLAGALALVLSVGFLEWLPEVLMVSIPIALFHGGGIPLGASILFIALFRMDPPAHKLPGHCRKCGYNLTGNVSGICPECGTTITCGTVNDPATGE